MILYGWVNDGQWMLVDLNGCEWMVIGPVHFIRSSLRQVMGPFVILRCWVSGAEAVSVINELERGMVDLWSLSFGGDAEVIGW